MLIKSIFLSLCIVWGSGCGISPEKASLLKLGETTTAEAVKSLGKPNEFSKISSLEVWAYYGITRTTYLSFSEGKLTAVNIYQIF